MPAGGGTVKSRERHAAKVFVKRQTKQDHPSSYSPDYTPKWGTPRKKYVTPQTKRRQKAHAPIRTADPRNKSDFPTPHPTGPNAPHPIPTNRFRRNKAQLASITVPAASLTGVLLNPKTHRMQQAEMYSKYKLRQKQAEKGWKKTGPGTLYSGYR